MFLWGAGGTLISLTPPGLAQVDSAQQRAQFLCRDLPPVFAGVFRQGHRVGAFLQTFAPHCKSVAIPIQDLETIAPPAGEHEQMPCESIQCQVIPDQLVPPVAALTHVATRQAKEYPHAGWQMDHARNASSTCCNVAASTPPPIRIRAPVVSTSSKAACSAGPGRGAASTKANRIGAGVCSRFRQ